MKIRSASKYPGRATRGHADVESDISRKRIKQISDAGDITWLDLAVEMDMTTAEVKRQPQKAILNALEAELQRSRDTAAAGNQVTIYEALGVEPVAFNIEVDGIHVQYVPAFKSLVSRGFEKIAINGIVISTSRPSDVDHMKKRIAAAIWGDWKAGVAAADVDAIVDELVRNIRSCN